MLMFINSRVFVCKFLLEGLCNQDVDGDLLTGKSRRKRSYKKRFSIGTVCKKRLSIGRENCRYNHFGMALAIACLNAKKSTSKVSGWESNPRP